MGYIKEPAGVDFIIKGKPLTDKEKKAISEFIRADKEKNKKSKKTIGVSKKALSKKAA